MLPPLHFQGVDPTMGFGFQSAPGIHPSRVAALVAANNVLQSQAGVVRTADQMEGVEDNIPPAKRQKVNRVPGSQIYSEEDWIGLHPHPISLQFQLPMDTTKAKWKLNSKIVTIPDLPLNLVSMLRECIIQTASNSSPNDASEGSETSQQLCSTS
ncbi:hypothetical protein BT96DRAFT_1081690 [Gymnopus androsaceus JB14]|uniref:Uncharacterized protein n=1 Tax=Gymnopus androsaceus JB14 TaxID=1447944 RepID=A0A6A4GNF8_9AGAR|nr:hypothetical protein BT96DRAFT_1081690 [Gymnopus androsaceus JB14]